jgi:hypothetical protein
MIIDIIEEQLTKPSFGCVVNKWVATLTTEEREGMEKLQATPHLNITELYNKLKSRIELPFKLTAFKSHMRGYCTCQP